MKKTILILMLFVVGVIFAGCDVTYDIQKNNSVIITIECDDDDVDEFGEVFDFDEGDLDNKEDLEDILEDILDEDDFEDLEGEITVKSFKRDKSDDFTLVFEFVPTDDVEDAYKNNEIVIGTALDVMDLFAEERSLGNYDDDFEDVYEDEFADDVDDERFYAFDKNGDELTDKEMEKYFDKAKLTKLNAALIQGEDIDVYVPGKVEIIISPDDSVDIDEGAISFDNYAIIIYKTGASVWTTILGIIVLAALGVGGYFAYDKFFAKKEDELDSELEAEITEE